MQSTITPPPGLEGFRRRNPNFSVTDNEDVENTRIEVCRYLRILAAAIITIILWPINRTCSIISGAAGLLNIRFDILQIFTPDRVGGCIDFIIDAASALSEALSEIIRIFVEAVFAFFDYTVALETQKPFIGPRMQQIERMLSEKLEKWKNEHMGLARKPAVKIKADLNRAPRWFERVVRLSPVISSEAPQIITQNSTDQEPSGPSSLQKRVHEAQAALGRNSRKDFKPDQASQSMPSTHHELHMAHSIANYHPRRFWSDTTHQSVLRAMVHSRHHQGRHRHQHTSGQGGL